MYFQCALRGLLPASVQMTSIKQRTRCPTAHLVNARLFSRCCACGACGYVRAHADDNRADQVFAPVVFVKFTRSVAISEPELTEVGAYLQRSCFVVGDHRLALAHRAMAGTQPGLLRFGRVLF